MERWDKAQSPSARLETRAPDRAGDHRTVAWSLAPRCTSPRSDLIGLGVIVLATAFTGVDQRARLGRAFQDAMPFTALLVTLLRDRRRHHDQGLFTPVIDRVLAAEGQIQLTLLFVATGAAVGDQRQRLRRDRLHHGGA